MTEKLRWGILGTGWIAELQTKDLLLAGSPVTAVGSRTQERAEAFAQEHGIPTAHGSYEALVADPEVDVIYVATPHPMHAADAKLALEAGKHVLVEKPFTINAAEAREVTALAAEKGLVVLEAMWTRWLPHMIRVREVLAAGTLGEVRTVIADHSQDLPDDPAHRIQNPELGGGALLDLGIYPVSFAWDVFGTPTAIRASSSPTPVTKVDRQTAMIFEYADGQQAVLSCVLDTAGPNRAVILGTEARIEIDGVFYTPTSFRVIASDGTVLETYESQVEGRGMQYQAAELERLVAEGKNSEILSPAETVAIMESLDEVRSQIGLTYPSER